VENDSDKQGNEKNKRVSLIYERKERGTVWLVMCFLNVYIIKLKFCDLIVKIG